MTRSILLFDGVCNLCNFGVQFILDHESAPILQFASMQSDAGRQILSSLGIKEFPRSMILVENGRALFRSQALLSVSKCLIAPYRWLGLLAVIPPIVRDPIYDFVATNRYRWFGMREVCRMPKEEEAGRFLNG